MAGGRNPSEVPEPLNEKERKEKARSLGKMKTRPLAKAVIRAGSRDENDNQPITMSGDSMSSNGPEGEDQDQSGLIPRKKRLKSGEHLAASSRGQVGESLTPSWIDPEVDEEIQRLHEKAAQEKDETKVYEARNRIRDLLIDQSRIRRATFDEIEQLYEEDTPESHEKIRRELVREQIMAVQVWDNIHRSGDLLLSQVDIDELQKPEVPNQFIQTLLDPDTEMGAIIRPVLEKPGSIFFGFGTGSCKDERLVARETQANVMGMDISQSAVQKANIRTEMEGLSDRIKNKHGDFHEKIKRCRGQLVHVGHSNSTSQYEPHQLTKHVIMPQIAEMLRPANGYFCLGMKLFDSDSAQSPYQIRLAPDRMTSEGLVPGNQYNPSLDLRHIIFRNYPGSEPLVHNLMTPSFNIVYSTVVDVQNYDRRNQTEKFVWTIGQPA